MGLDLINGIPAHVLFVHVVVVLVPLTALALILCAAFPSVMRRFGLALPVLALVSLISVPLTTDAGEWLERHVASDPLVRRHAELGDELLPWAIGLFLVAAAVWWFYRRDTRGTLETKAAGSTVAAPCVSPQWSCPSSSASAPGCRSTASETQAPRPLGTTDTPPPRTPIAADG
ncbi:DUF2231 domain-containing protein [Streptomyces acidiscabies]|uniref:DUF2231 domain-containing protein n=1 Tax=Streptomyces acidiscabies TaxID=42234 RepID=UPI000AD7A3ED|nr:DUF2231 domain-containing protein [Streptomyces acidiscabies]